MIHHEGVDYAKVERDYRRWWEINGADKSLHLKLPAGTTVVWPLRKLGENGRPVEDKVGGFCHVEFESEQVEMWGFERNVDRLKFHSLYGGEIV